MSLKQDGLVPAAVQLLGPLDPLRLHLVRARARARARAGAGARVS